MVKYSEIQEKILLNAKVKEFVSKFNELKKKRFVPSKRKGPTGIGHTLEAMLGIKENNIALPDLGKIELKAHRNNSNNLITLFTFNKKAWQMPPLEAVKKYGSLDKNGRKGLYYTMLLKPNSAGLFLQVSEFDIIVRHVSGQIVVKWNLNSLMERFIKKIPALIFVSAHTEERDGKEYFHFFRAQLLTGITPDLLSEQFKLENILVDLRLHDKGTRARNHGTGFRVYEDKLLSLFNEVRDL